MNSCSTCAFRQEIPPVATACVKDGKERMHPEVWDIRGDDPECSFWKEGSAEYNAEQDKLLHFDPYSKRIL